MLICGKQDSVVFQCKVYAPLDSLPTTKMTVANVKSICNETQMDGREKCAGSKIGTCNTYQFTLACVKLILVCRNAPIGYLSPRDLNWELLVFYLIALSIKYNESQKLL